MFETKEQRAARLQAIIETERAEFERTNPGLNLDELERRDMARMAEINAERAAKAAKPRVYTIRCEADQQARYDRVLPMWRLMQTARKDGKPWSATQRRVLAILKIRADRDLIAKVATKDLACAARCSRRAAQMACFELREARLISYREVRIDRSRSEINRYEVDPDLWLNEPGAAPARRELHPGGEGAKRCAVQGELNNSLPDQSGTATGRPATAPGPRPHPGPALKTGSGGGLAPAVGSPGGRTRKRRAKPGGGGSLPAHGRFRGFD